jgi:ribonucleoside-triphosphate reductase (formate)
MTKTKCEVYSRVVGYIRPVEQWNDGKREEFKDRKLFSVKTIDSMHKEFQTRMRCK